MYHYRESGLDWVYLANGFRWHDTSYGRGVSIENVDGLHQTITLEIIAWPSRIRGQEVRFLRSIFELSRAELARVIGDTEARIARWEMARSKVIPARADRALRLYAGRVSGGARPGSRVLPGSRAYTGGKGAWVRQKRHFRKG